jgi:2-keto-4-pentenoate hydratase
MNMWEDPRIVRGMQAQADMRRQRLADGDRLIGWKVGFGAPTMLERLKIDGPLVGFLTQNARVQSGGSVSFAGWSKPVIEPEIAVFIGRDVPAGADRETARTTDPQANTGEWLAIVPHVANLLAALGERLRAGEFIITGSVVPPLTVEPGEDGVTFAADPIGSVSVRFLWT